MVSHRWSRQLRGTIIHPLVLVVVLEAIGFIGLNRWLSALAGSALGIMMTFTLTNQLRRISSVTKVIELINHLCSAHHLLHRPWHGSLVIFLRSSGLFLRDRPHPEA